MADIALLEVEEFERRRKWAKEDGLKELHHLLRDAFMSGKRKVEERVSTLKEAEIVRRAMEMEPRSEFVLAALDGLFSA